MCLGVKGLHVYISEWLPVSCQAVCQPHHIFGYGVTQTGEITAVWPAVVLAVLFSHTGRPCVLLFWGTHHFGVLLQQCKMTTPPFSVVF